jgi:hypothetical protein
MKPIHSPINWLAGALVALTLLQLPVAAQASWNDAEHRIDVTQTPRAFDRSTRTLFSYVTLANASDSVSLTGPFRLVVPTSAINGNAVDVTNKDGDTTGSEPYLDLAEGTLAPGEAVTLRVEFPLQRGALAFTTRAEIFHTENTYTVTGTTYGGPGSIKEAIDLANGNPGCDIIEFTPGLQVNAADNPGPIGGGDDYVLSRITECVTIDGKGGALLGIQSWIDQSGRQDFNICPNSPAAPGTIILANMPGFVNIGTYGQDNTGIDVTIRDLTLRQFNHIAAVYENASLLMEDVTVNETWSTYNCAGYPIIDARAGATVTLRDSTFAEYFNWQNLPEVRAAAFVGIDAGDLTIERCLLLDLLVVAPQPAIFWGGAPGNQMNIVSTIGHWARGIHTFGDAETNIVNSLWMNGGPLESPRTDDGFLNGSSGDMNIIASTLFWNFDECDLECQKFESLGFPTHFVDRFGTGQVNIRQSAIGFNETGGMPTLLTLHDQSTGGFTADEYTWIEPTNVQGETELKAITGQGALRTGSPAFNTPVYFPVGNYMQTIGTPTTGGVLINQVPDAGTMGANELINPIDNQPITEDVFGNPRVDGTTRNIGAVQDDALLTPP